MMTRSLFFQRAIEDCIAVDENSGIAYVEPLYVDILESEGFSDELAMYGEQETLQVLELAAKKANAKSDHTRAVVDMIYDLLTNTVEPEVVEQQNDLMKNVVEYMQLNQSLKDRESEIEKVEDATKKKFNISKMFPGMNFEKGV